MPEVDDPTMAGCEQNVGNDSQLKGGGGKRGWMCVWSAAVSVVFAKGEVCWETVP